MAVEVDARVGVSTSSPLKHLGLRRSRLYRTTREISEEVEKASFWLWLRRRDRGWGQNT